MVIQTQEEEEKSTLGNIIPVVDLVPERENKILDVNLPPSGLGVACYTTDDDAPVTVYSAEGQAIGQTTRKVLDQDINWSFPNKMYLNVELPYDLYGDPLKRSTASGHTEILQQKDTIVQVRPVYRTDMHPTGDYLARLTEDNTLEPLAGLPEIDLTNGIYYYEVVGWIDPDTALLTQREPNGHAQGAWLYDLRNNDVVEIMPSSIRAAQLLISPDRQQVAIIVEVGHPAARQYPIRVFDFTKSEFLDDITCDEQASYPVVRWHINDSQWLGYREELQSVEPVYESISLGEKQFSIEDFIHYFDISESTPNTVTISAQKMLLSIAWL